MKAEIISIGTEILLGEILDTNAQYIAARLPARITLQLAAYARSTTKIGGDIWRR
ncbi:MAG TPA: hypothetical protein VK009_25570 [Chloroflexota bacterium]|nr:hypothetical protein [Chloroflexota bacterium]